jgi:hypothetical protein
VQVGSTVSIDLHSAGLLPYDEVARLALGSGNSSGTSPDGWSYQNYRTDGNSNYYTTTNGTINLSPAAPSSSVANSQYVVANTAPASVYSEYAYEPGGIGAVGAFSTSVALLPTAIGGVH